MSDIWQILLNFDDGSYYVMFNISSAVIIFVIRSITIIVCGIRYIKRNLAPVFIDLRWKEISWKLSNFLHCLFSQTKKFVWPIKKWEFNEWWCLKPLLNVFTITEINIIDPEISCLDLKSNAFILDIFHNLNYLALLIIFM